MLRLLLFLSYFQHPIIFLCLVHKIVSSILPNNLLSFATAMGRNYSLEFVYVCLCRKFSSCLSWLDLCSPCICHGENSGEKVGFHTILRFTGLYMFWSLCSSPLHGLLLFLKGSALGSLETYNFCCKCMILHLSGMVSAPGLLCWQQGQSWRYLASSLLWI